MLPDLWTVKALATNVGTEFEVAWGSKRWVWLTSSRGIVGRATGFRFRFWFQTWLEAEWGAAGTAFI
jgi:hypothetical protein